MKIWSAFSQKFMEWNSKEVRMTRSAFGRNAMIGELYDARSEALTSRSLFKKSMPENFIKNRDTSKTELNYKFTENASDRFDLLKVEAELQVSILLGLFKAGGSGQFLSEERLSEKTVSCTFVCNFQTVCETLFASFEEIIKYMDLDALQDSNNTHVVIEINWGANCLLTLEAAKQSESDKKEIEGVLKAEINSLLNIVNTDGKGEGTTNVSNNSWKDDITVKVSADIISEQGLPTTIEGFRDFIQEISTLLKKVNDGKGKPLNFALIPLDALRKAAKLEINMNVVVKAIDESFLLSMVYLFEDIASIKRKLFDLNKDIKNLQKYVLPEKVKEAREQQEELEIKESDLKMVIAEEWTKVKTGVKNLKDVIKNVKRFENRELDLSGYEDFLDSFDSVGKKLETVKNYLSSGCIYLGQGEKFTDLNAKNPKSEFIVLIMSSETEKFDPELHLNTTSLFLAMVSEASANTLYVVIDLDFQEKGSTNYFNIKENQTKCLHWKEGRVLQSDMYQIYLIERYSNIVRLRDIEKLQNIQHKPGNRINLEMTCPAFQKGTCSHEKLKWICSRCKHFIEYGFNNFFYCLCGGAIVNEFEFRCSDPKHGNNFVSSDITFLKNQLSVLRPLKEMNILILGQSGVGKSTWINSIMNYMSYDTMEEAKQEGVICEIPVSFTVTNSKTLKTHEISVGTERKNENTTAGSSATQVCHTYTFLWKDKYIRLIDTPGLGDTRGIHQDKINMENIIEHISNFKELHGICILLKASDNRLNVLFSYCVKELLVHLHKSVARNIVFCFTNARASFYGPGRTTVLLQNLIQNLDIKNELVLGNYNMFYLDNESFIFLCTWTDPEIQYEKELVDSFAKSWEISLKETIRLFSTIRSFEPHSLQETLSLVAARNRIVSLTVPVAQVSKTIHVNLEAIKSKKKEIQMFEDSIQDITKRLTINEIHLEPIELERPQTVCTNSSCIEYHVYQGVDVTDIEYKTICHGECYLENVKVKTTNNGVLMHCKAMSCGICQICGCSWTKHMHLKIAQKRVERKVLNKKAESDILGQKTNKEKIEAFVKDLEEKTEQYKNEQDIIIKTSVKFGMFLKQNAISVYNDSVLEYLEYLIQEEENKPHKSESEKNLIKSLQTTLNNYKEENRILQEVVNKTVDGETQITPQEVLQLEKNLYALPLTGKDIQKNVNAGRDSNKKAFDYGETPLNIKNRKPKENTSKSHKFDKYSWSKWKFF